MLSLDSLCDRRDRRNRRRRCARLPRAARITLIARETAAFREEILERVCALVGEHAACHRGVMIELPVREHVDDTAARARFRVRRAIDDARNARMHDRARAHQARLQRHIELAARQPVILEFLRGGAQRGHFGMRGRIVPADRMIEARRDNFVAEDNHRAHRHFAGTAGFFGGALRERHEAAVALDGGIGGGERIGRSAGQHPDHFISSATRDCARSESRSAIRRRYSCGTQPPPRSDSSAISSASILACNWQRAVGSVTRSNSS